MAPDEKQLSTILIVDDDPGALLVSTKPLRNAGYTVLQAPGSAEALRLYAEHPGPIHLVIADVFLPPPDFQLSVDKNPYPRLNGRDMVERLLQDKREIRVLFMSGSPGSELQNRGLVRAGLPFLKKPFTSEMLLSLVREVLAGPPATPDQKSATQPGNGDVEWVD
ncbi:MAG: response regulator [Nitrospira sp.]|nr:response regulator [Nitrospira sp.]